MLKADCIACIDDCLVADVLSDQTPLMVHSSEILVGRPPFAHARPRVAVIDRSLRLCHIQTPKRIFGSFPTERKQLSSNNDLCCTWVCSPQSYPRLPHTPRGVLHDKVRTTSCLGTCTTRSTRSTHTLIRFRSAACVAHYTPIHQCQFEQLKTGRDNPHLRHMCTPFARSEMGFSARPGWTVS